MKTKKFITVMILSLTLGACASNNAQKITYVDASVQSYAPASDICYYPKKKSDTSAGNVLLGAGLGGLAGNQFGSGKGRAAMTVLGALTGISIAVKDKRDKPEDRGGPKLVCKSNGYDIVVSYLHPITNTMVTETRKADNVPTRTNINIPVSL